MGEWLLYICKGALIGVGAILPGISGGALSVVFGIYKPLMAFLAHPIRTFKESFQMLLPVLIGWALGVLLLARLLGFVLESYPVPSTWAFIGLMVGTFPSLWREAGQQGRPKFAWVALVVAAAVMGGLLYLFSSSGTGVRIEPGILTWVVCGVFWGLGIIVPGLSPSSLFLFFGIYDLMMAGIGRLDFAIIIPIAIGLLATVLLLARAMNLLLKRAYPWVMHAILGIVIASTIAILPLGTPATGWQIVLYIVCFAIGCAAAIGMDVLGKKVEATKEKA